MADDPKTHEPNQLGSVNPETEPKADVPGEAEKRKPGRPPKAPTPVDNTNAQYTPSVERNEASLAQQPTGMKGDNAIAGWGDWGNFNEAELNDLGDEWKPIAVDNRMASLVSKDHDSPAPISPPDPKEKLFPVRIVRNYRPMSDRWYPILRNGKVGKPPRNEDGTTTKVMKGYSVLLPLSEAKQVIARGIGERADDLPNEIRLTADEASRIPDHAWRFVEETEDFIRYEARVTLPNGVSGTVLRTEQKGADALLEQNAELRKENSGQRYTAGMGSDKGGNMPLVQTASIPLNIYFRDVAPRQAAGDKDYLRWWLNQEQNKPFLVREKGMRK